MIRLAVLAAALVCTPPWIACAQSSAWRTHVKQDARDLTDPLARTPENAAAGAELYHRNCAGCHSTDAQGRGHRPSLRSDGMSSTPAGELFWLLRNGSLAHGMPSWSRLPEPERWQIIQYLRTLPEQP